MNAKIKLLLSGEVSNHIFPFLWLHGEDEKTLRRYVNVIYNAGMRSFCVESRPHPDFVGTGWWRDMDIILDEAEKKGMRVWILDDSHFPTGYANGALKNCDPALCRQSLIKKEIACPKSGETLVLHGEEFTIAPAWQPTLMEQYAPQDHLRKFDDDVFLGAVAVKRGGGSVEELVIVPVENDAISFSVPEGEWKLFLLCLTRNRGPHRDYINMMNPASVRLLIDAVYEPHYAHYNKEFGKTIAGFFSDEPELGNGHLYDYGKRLCEIEDHAWSTQLEIALQEKWGNDFLKYLPLLWEENFADECKAKARCDYMESVTRLTQDAFSDQLGTWCSAHGVEYIGHLIEDNNQHTRTGSGLGHFFRGEAGQDMAGIDDIGGQVLPQGEWNGPFGLTQEARNGLFYHYVLGKLGVSAASIDPKKQGRCMCEIFGNYGWEEGVRLEKYLLDHFLVQGVNRFVPHAFSPAPFPDPDCPPHFYAHGNNPQYRHFGALMGYANRACELLSGGKRIVKVAVLYHAESEWLGSYTVPEELAQILTENQIDFDFLPADVFTETEKYGTEISKALRVNGNEYTAFLIPKAQYLPKCVTVACKQIRGAYLLDGVPEGVYNGKEIEAYRESIPVVNSGEIIEILRQSGAAEITLSPANNRVRVLRYQGDSPVYMLVNEGETEYCGSVVLPDMGACYAYNAWQNRLESVSAKTGKHGTVVSLSLAPLKSLFIVFDRAEEPLEEEKEYEHIPANDGWTRTKCRSIAYPNFAEEKKVNLPDEAEKEYPKFSGFFRYERELNGNGYDGLEISDAHEGVEVFVNGVSLGIQIAPPFRYDFKNLLTTGKNAIRIEVATTLERELAGLPDPTRSFLGLPPKQPICRSGLSGKVYLLKEKKA